MLVVASNRGVPVQPAQGGGGLIAIVRSALSGSDDVWISAVPASAGIEIDAETYAAYYGRISTRTLWFAHHHLPFTEPSVDDWRAYERVNGRFADACARVARQGSTVLLLDYHLAVAPAMLRALRPDLRVIHCTMCPWADPQWFAVLPEWLRRKLVEGMLGADALSFFVPRWRDAFLECCAGLGVAVDPASIHAIPVGVDPASLPVPPLEMSNVEDLVAGRRLVLRVDRLDPTKNILRGVEAYGRFLESHPEWHGRVVHYVLAYESRSELPEYKSYSAEIHALVESVNGRFRTAGWEPIILDTRNDMKRALALMALADVLIVNPVRDGMNLVVKETAAVNRRDCAIILSRDAGAADELGAGALLIDPYDTAGTGYALAVALSMPPGERKRRMALLRRAATAVHPRQWLSAVLSTVAR